MRRMKMARDIVCGKNDVRNMSFVVGKVLE
jgi:hypothetical protein